MDSRTASVLVNDPPASKVPYRVREALAWRYLRWAGIVSVTVGMTDLLLAWLPFRVGVPEWEFGIATATMENLPLTMVGLTMILAAGVALNNTRSMAVVGAFMMALLLVVIVFSLLFALNVPLALKAVTAEPARTTLEKSIAKTSVQSVVYILFFGLVGFRTLRYALGKKQIEVRQVAPVTN